MYDVSAGPKSVILIIQTVYVISERFIKVIMNDSGM